MLYRYDVAAWYSTDAVQALKPPAGRVGCYIAVADGEKWKVAFGHIEGDKYLLAYEAFQGATPKDFSVRTYDPPREDTGFYLIAAKAIVLARHDFGQAARPYNISVIPAPDNQLYLYVYPAQTVDDIFPIGGDVRYLVSADGTKIIEKRQMHKTVLDISNKTPGTLEGMVHTHFLSDVPEDTDVFHVLARTPLVPEYVRTEHFLYEVKEDGSIKVVQEIKKKDKKK